MIAYTQPSDSSQCNYAEPSSCNPHLSVFVSVRKVIGREDKKMRNQEWRTIFINFIENQKLTSIDLTKDKPKSKNELLIKVGS